MSSVRARNPWLLVLISLMLTLCLWGGVACAADEPAQPATVSILGLVNEIGFPVSVKGEGRYEVTFSNEDTARVFSLFDASLYDEPHGRGVYMTALIGRVDRKSKTFPNLAIKIAEVNTSVVVGRLGLYEDAVVYSSFLWMTGADAQMLYDELCIGAMTCSEMKETLSPWLLSKSKK